MQTSSKATRRAIRVLLPVACFAAIAGVYEWTASAPKAAAREPNQTSATIVPSLRLSGTFGALDSATLTAPRILGSRSALNRGGDFNSGGSGPAGGAAADFNLVILTLAKPGSRVKAGDVVAQFDAQNQKQRLDDYKVGVEQLDRTIDSMTANLAATKEAQDQTVRAAKASWDQALLDLKTQSVLSDIEAERKRLSAEEAEAVYRQTLQEVSLLEDQQRAQIRASELNRNQSKFELQRAEANVEKMTVRAPMEGIVVMSSIVRDGEFGQIREGDQVYAGQPFLSIVNPDSMVLNATVNQVDAERLRMGMQARVRVDAYPEIDLPGAVTAIGALAVTSSSRAGYVGQIPVRVQIHGADHHLIPDLTGSAELQIAR